MTRLLPLAPDPVFWTIQGEGHLRGFQMAFVRLAGCSVGCGQCDTDYAVHQRVAAAELAAMVDRVTPAESRDRWVWITGGEPTDHDLRDLFGELRRLRFSIALATSGHNRAIPPVDWLSVSPHHPDKWLQPYGNEVKLVPGLHGLDLDEMLQRFPDDRTDFMYRYVQPLWDVRRDEEDRDSLRDCLLFLRSHPNWSLSRQDHKWWGVP